MRSRVFGGPGGEEGDTLMKTKGFRLSFPLIFHRRIALCIGVMIGSAWLVVSAPVVMGQEGSQVSSAAQHQNGSSLVYVSDFFSFVGRDTIGRVAFTLDNNRGKDGNTWQGEHLVILLHDEHKGWKELEGTGPYDNTEKQLLKIPNSPYFDFNGDPATGLTITNSQYKLTLEIDPIQERVSRKDGQSSYRMGSSEGTLKWQDRTLTGWVIHERLEMANFNRLTHQYFDLWTESYGIYAWIDGSPDFLYFHKQANETRLTPLVGNLVGFGVFANKGEHLQNLKLTVMDSTQAWGLYQWPRNWEGKWIGRKGLGAINMDISDLQVISNFILGGLAMGIIQGEITYDGKTRKIYGMGELLF